MLRSIPPITSTGRKKEGRAIRQPAERLPQISLGFPSMSRRTESGGGGFSFQSASRASPSREINPARFEIKKEKRRTFPRVRVQILPNPNSEIEVMDEGDYFWVVGNMPGTEKEDIHFQVRGQNLTLTTKSPFAYTQKVLLPTAVNIAQAVLSYKNGIFSLKLPKF